MAEAKIEQFLKTSSEFSTRIGLQNPEVFLSQNTAESLEQRKQRLLSDVLKKEQEAENLRIAIKEIRENQQETSDKSIIERRERIERLKAKKEALVEKRRLALETLEKYNMTHEDYKTTVENLKNDVQN